LTLSATSFGQQTDNGSFTGIVTDPNKQVVPGAIVTATNLATGTKRTVTANGEGRWTIVALPLGEYVVKAEAENFRAVQQRAVVSASNTTTVELSLALIEQSISIVVEDRATNSSISTDQSPVTQSTISGKALEKLPAANRSAFSTLASETSVSADLTDPLTNGTGNPETSINGNRTTSVSVNKDGVDATNLTGTGSLTENFSPAPETVQEVKVLTSLYDASLGRNGGGNVQVVTRRGENQFNGVAYLYGQNEIFNANDFFYNRDGIDRQKARRWEGGFTVGGPIVKDKTFFFGGYQRTDASTAYVPTAQSLVVLPEALAFTTQRTPEALRLAFRKTAAGFDNPNCITQARIPKTINPGLLQFLCIDPFGPGFKLLNRLNPVTGDFVVPTLRPGNYQPLYLDPRNTKFDATADLNAFPDKSKIPLLDFIRESGIGGGIPLARVRNVFPADFTQDQFTTRIDHAVWQGKTQQNNLSGTFFFANFPATEPFSEDTVVSPFPLVRDDRNRILAITDTHIFGPALVNEARFGYYYLINTRELDSRLLTPPLTNQGLGIQNPATVFAPGPETDRCGRVSGRGDIQDFWVCAPNDIFNRRKQVTLTFADNVTYLPGGSGVHTLRFGVEHKRNSFDTNLPEEQAGDFEKMDNFKELLLGYVPEADTAFGSSDKAFRFNDLSFYVTDDWKVGKKLTLNLGLRWDWFGWPIETNGRFANFDPSLLTNPDDPRPGFLLPKNAKPTGFNAIDASLPNIKRADNNNTLNGQDFNNFAPRFGFAFMPFKNGKTTIRGGYGIFYDRPSASFINTVYKNYPYFREIEIREDLFSPFALQYENTFGTQNPQTPFSDFLPFRIQYVQGISVASPLQLFDNRNMTTVIGNVPYHGDRAESLEFRAVDRDLKTPLIQQWNLGIQHEIGKGWVVEARYVGTRGQQLLLAVGFNQAYDLNDPATPDYIYERLNQAYLQKRATQPGIPPLRQAATARERGCGMAFGASIVGGISVPGFPWPLGPACPGFTRLNYDFDSYSNSGAEGTDLIDTTLRVPYLGFDPVESIMLQSRGNSIYHSGQLNLSKRFGRGIGINLSYTFSKSIDIGSTDPGSTAASGRPDTPNLGLVVQGDQRNINSNRALSDFDRPHRFAGTFIWELPTFGSKSKWLTGWQLSGFGQWQSGTPFTVLASDVEFIPINQSGNFQQQFIGFFRQNEIRRDPRNPNGSVALNRIVFNAGRASGTLYNAGFGRPNVRDLDLLKLRSCGDITLCYFNTLQNPDNPQTALLAAYGGFGNLGRNLLRGPGQKRVDLSLMKTIKFTERYSMELKWDVFNVFNFVNFANPNADLTDETDFGQITKTVGAPRVMQFGAKFRF
jgi:hypothetical protein